MSGQVKSKPNLNAPLANATGKQRSGFKKGQSGNPLGKKPGTRNRVSLAVEALLEGEHEALTRAAIDRAKTGNTEALRICLERIAPVRKSRHHAYDLGVTLDTLGDLAHAQKRVIEGLASGDLTGDEADALSRAIRAKADLLEKTELAVRLARLEELIAQGAGADGLPARAEAGAIVACPR